MAKRIKKNNFNDVMDTYGDMTVEDLLVVQMSIAEYLENFHGIDQAELADKTNAINNDLVRQYGNMICDIKVDMGDSEVTELVTCINMCAFAASAMMSAAATLPAARDIMEDGLISTLADKVIESVEKECD